MVIGAVNELPPLTTDVESLAGTTDESVVGNAPGWPIPSAVTDEVGVAAGDVPATTELSSVGNRAGAVALGPGDALFVAVGASGFCGNALASPPFVLSSAAC